MKKAKRKSNQAFGPSADSQQVSEGVWFYETRGGIDVYVQPCNVKTEAGIISFRIPRRMLERSLARMSAQSMG